MTPANAKALALKWIQHFDAQRRAHRTNNVLVLWGDDFAHEKADRTFANLNLTIHSINEKYGNSSSTSGIKYDLKISTIREYLQSVKRDAKRDQVTWNRKTGDFWAYNYQNNDYSYWTGYFSTYPDFKYKATSFSDFAQSSQLITSLSSDKVNDQFEFMEQ